MVKLSGLLPAPPLVFGQEGLRPESPGRLKPSKLSKAAARRNTRPKVEARANGRCEAGIPSCRGRLHWDHFFGRAKVPPSVELEWMICEEHDHQKTCNVPSRLTWLNRFLLHAIRYDYADAVERTRNAITLEMAQHPQKVTA